MGVFPGRSPRRGYRFQSSPRTGGCFSRLYRVFVWSIVFPTHVGVFPLHEIALDKAKSLPHARGGVSFFMENDLWNLKSSPRTWGCFCAAAARPMSQAVFPTHVGVFPGSCTSGRRTSRLPHARGGVSQTADATKRQKDVFPTHVGVFHARGGLVRFWHCLPHARRGGAKQGLPPKAPSPQLGLFTSALDIDSFIWRE